MAMNQTVAFDSGAEEGLTSLSSTATNELLSGTLFSPHLTS
jgi:hypothetical protein